MSKHAFLSASGAPAWSRCELKVWREKGMPDETSINAAEGTAAHFLLEQSMKDGHFKAGKHLGKNIGISVFGEVNWNSQWLEQSILQFEFQVTEDMGNEVQKTLNLIAELAK